MHRARGHFPSPERWTCLTDFFYQTHRLPTKPIRKSAESKCSEWFQLTEKIQNGMTCLSFQQSADPIGFLPWSWPVSWPVTQALHFTEEFILHISSLWFSCTRKPVFKCKLSQHVKYFMFLVQFTFLELEQACNAEYVVEAFSSSSEPWPSTKLYLHWESGFWWSYT